MRIYSVFNCALGDSSPFAPRSKMVAPVVAGAAIAGGASLLGNLIGAFSNKSANATNLEIARLNNEQQYKMFQEQNAFNLDMWNKNNEYNLPANQVKRLLDAGINPSAVFGNGSVTPSSQISSATAPQLHTAQVRPFSPDFSGVGDSVNAFFDNQIKNKSAQAIGLDIDEKRIDLQFRAMQHLQNLVESRARVAKALSEVNKNSAEYKNLIKQAEVLDLDLKKYRETYDELVRREKLQNDVYENQATNLLADSSLKRAQAFYQSLLSKYYPDMAQADLDIKSAEFKNILEDTSNKVREGRLTNAKTTSQYIQNRLQNIDLWHELNKKGRFSADRDVRSAADYWSGLIFDNLKLFGK